jgi:hypothetical protein
MRKSTVTRTWLGGLVLLALGLLVAGISIGLMLAYGGSFTKAANGNGYDFLPRYDSFFWTTIGIMIGGFVGRGRRAGAARGMDRSARQHVSVAGQDLVRDLGRGRTAGTRVRPDRVRGDGRLPDCRTRRNDRRTATRLCAGIASIDSRTHKLIQTGAGVSAEATPAPPFVSASYCRGPAGAVTKRFFVGRDPGSPTGCVRMNALWSASAMSR